MIGLLVCEVIPLGESLGPEPHNLLLQTFEVPPDHRVIFLMG